MRKPALLAIGLLAASCDSAGDVDRCLKGTGTDRCPRSEFRTEDESSRRVVGRVWAGLDNVQNALVRIDSRSGSPDGRSMLTDAAGFFRFEGGPLFYDVTVKGDSPPDAGAGVFVFKGIALRGYDPTLEDRPVSRAWQAHVTGALSTAPAAGDDVMFLATGDKVHGLTGDLAHGFAIAIEDFVEDVTLRAIEYPKGASIAQAVASGRVDLHVQAGTDTPFSIALAPLPEKVAKFVVDVSGPAGFVVDPIGITADFGSRASEVGVTTIIAGAPSSLALIPDASYQVKITARRDGATTDAGRRGFNPRDATTDILLVDGPVVRGPAAGTIAADTRLSAAYVGVVEHVLVPTAGGATVHIASVEGDVALPDLSLVGLPRMKGTYVWTARGYPDFRFIEAFSGSGARTFVNASAPPRTITIP